jgi:hypothetical protein
MLLAGELVTNAIVHTATASVGLVVCWWTRPCASRSTTRARSSHADRLAGWDAERGRGLGLMAALATRWGVAADRHRDGKAVWFEVHPAEPA